MQDYNISLGDVHRIRQRLQESFNLSLSLDRDCDGCHGVVQELAVVYANHYHGYLAIVVCLFGIVTNMMTIAVLTRKDMMYAPINRILIGIAVADILLMIEYVSFAYYYYIDLSRKLNFPYWGAVFVLFHAHFTQVLHTISIFLTLALAMWRYLAIGYPDKNHIYCSEKRCTMFIYLGYLLPVALCSPTYFVVEIKATPIIEDNQPYILYHTQLSRMAAHNDSYMVFNFWMYGVVIKLLPCCILTVITIWLIRTLFKAKKRRRVLQEGYNAVTPAGANNKIKPSNQADRTTRMLVAVLCLFLVTEFPQGIFGLLIGLKGRCVFLVCYQKFGEIMDILALLNGTINFIVYCCTNRLFRSNFRQLFKHKILHNWALVSQSDNHTTYV